jgi:predicted nucleic acid-binding protein
LSLVVDSSIWLEILLSQPLKAACLKEIKSKKLFIPTLSFYECFKKLRSKVSDHEAVEAISSLYQYPHLDLTPEIALNAADLSIEFNLGMADSLILAHARAIDGILLTLDNDFSSVPGVKVLRPT